MSKKNYPTRVYTGFKNDMERILQKRVSLGLMKYKEAKIPKATELLTRTEGYKMSLKELELKPERKKR